MTKFMNLFTRKRSPFTLKASNNGNTVNANQVNPYAYGRRSEYNQSSPLNRAKKISHTYEIGEKVGIREIPSYLPPSEKHLFTEGEGIITEIVKFNNDIIHSYTVKFNTSGDPRELIMYPYMLKKIRQGGGSAPSNSLEPNAFGGSKRRRHRSKKHRTVRRKH